MLHILFNRAEILQIESTNYSNVIECVEQAVHLPRTAFYLEQEGKRLCDKAENINTQSIVHVQLRLLGGKGGFGSMLRAIGAQIEKTTNREACRDLSGRRLRDINEEKRLKAWLDKEGERQREAEERKKRKIEKLLAVPKHEFKDAKYEEARSKLMEKVNDAVEEGFKKTQVATKEQVPTTSKGLKRKNETAAAVVKKKKAALWIGDDISDDSDTESSDDDEAANVKNAKAITA